MSFQIAFPAFGAVFVEEVPIGSALAEAGLERGDLLLAWERPGFGPPSIGPNRGELVSYLDWLDLVIEQAPRGPITLIGSRAGLPYRFRIEPGSWTATVRPVLTDRLERQYLEAKWLVDAGLIAPAFRVISALMTSLDGENSMGGAAWAAMWIASHAESSDDFDEAERLLGRVLDAEVEPSVRLATQEALGDLQARSGDLAGAVATFQAVLRARETSEPGSLHVSNALKRIGDTAWGMGDIDLAEQSYTRALTLDSSLAPGSMAESVSLSNVGSTLLERGYPRAAYLHHRRALTISESIAPDSLDTAVTMSNLGIAAQDIGEPEEADEHFRRALRIKETVAPGTATVAITRNNLGALALTQGNLQSSQEHLAAALVIQERLEPGSLNIATTLNNLGSVATQRGALDDAHRYYTQATDILSKFSPENLKQAAALNNLAQVAGKRGELERAKALYLKTLKVIERSAPRSLAEVYILIGLGSTARTAGDLVEAERYYQRALELSKSLAPTGIEIGYLLHNLGVIAYHSGDPDMALGYLSAALDIKNRVAPNSLNAAATYQILADLYIDIGKEEEAESNLAKALHIRRLIGPSSKELAESLHSAARLSEEKGDLRAATAYNIEAITALEEQVSRLGGAYDVQASFRASNSAYYHTAIDRLIAVGNLDSAFHVSERFRARVFLAMLAERDLMFGSDIPAELDQERRRIATQYDQELQHLSKWTEQDGVAAFESARERLASLRRQAGEVEATIRLLSPHLAALQYPDPLDTERTRLSLATGTVLLSYVVEEERTRLFTLSRFSGVRATTIELREKELRDRVNEFLIALQRSRLSRRHLEDFQKQSSALFNALIAPVAVNIAGSSRVLILPDGPLHAIPFAALLRATDEGDQYLIEWKPLHVALSATVYAELTDDKERGSDELRPTTLERLVALGDPAYSSADVETDGLVRSIAERIVFDWSPLPYTRKEVEAIAGLFPRDTTQVFLGADATEERVKELDSRTQILHLAAHGYLDEQLPSSSFIALSSSNPDPLPGGAREGDNGLLQVWEIFESVRVDASLVVLSACETGLGEQLDGEGVIGLTRAFQYAGARSVIASLWNVADDTTAALMVELYRQLQQGQSKDRALQAAQLALLRGTIPVDEDGDLGPLGTSSPYYWAPFQLYGDWR